MKSALADAVNKLTKSTKDKVALTIARAIIRLVNDANPIQSVQVDLLSGETRDKVERIQNYGFTSVPLPGCRAIALFIGGDRSNGSVIACDDTEYRLKELKPGEVAIYTDEGDHVLLKRGRVVEVVTKKMIVNAEDEIVLHTPLTTFDGRFRMTGGLSSESSVMKGGFSNEGGKITSNNVTLEEHTHGGVQSGSSNTSRPNTG